jgi:hypothetical protein
LIGRCGYRLKLCFRHDSSTQRSFNLSVWSFGQLPKPPAPAFFHQLMIHVQITVEYRSQRPAVLISPVALNSHVLAEEERGSGLLGLLPESLPLLRAIDAIQPDAFWFFVVEHFNGIAVQDSNNFALEVGSQPSRDGHQQTPKYSHRLYEDLVSVHGESTDFTGEEQLLRLNVKAVNTRNIDLTY